MGHNKLHRLAGDYLVRWVCKFNEDSVRSWRQPYQNNGFPAGIDKVPRRIVDRDVNMSDAGRHRKRALAEDRYHAKILGPVLDEDATERQWLGKRRIDDKSGCRLILDGQER